MRRQCDNRDVPRVRIVLKDLRRLPAINYRDRYIHEYKVGLRCPGLRYTFFTIPGFGYLVTEMLQNSGIYDPIVFIVLNKQNHLTRLAHLPSHGYCNLMIDKQIPYHPLHIAIEMPVDDTQETTLDLVQRPVGRPYRNVRDVRSVSMLGVGIVIGSVIGAGIALLVAPQSGTDTRRSLSRRVGGLRTGPGVWGKLGKELRRAAAAKRKALEMETRRKELLLKRTQAGNV